jgi:uncharacterized protein YqhQ
LERFLKQFSFARFFNKPANSTTNQTNKAQTKEEDMEKRKNQIMAIGFAMTAMLTYAFAIGLIKIDVLKTDLFYVEKS